ncbi:hypothetical protein [Chryseobacterium sp. MP_3.2]|uniref:hypothetical protein n=1 Tax=Chryseobacterium sp. MP_3.2 TaxID=3071712 RepID=UPI002E0151C9|nr:hypothetical protein [Chryseobacterium sp. MP_3.2]
MALAPAFLSCATVQVDRVTFEPLLVSAGTLLKVRGNVNKFNNRGGTVGVFETKDGFDTLFIFGHADKPEFVTGNKSNLNEMANFLAASNEFVLKAIKEGKTTEQLTKEHALIPGFENRKTPERFTGFLDELRKTLTV